MSKQAPPQDSDANEGKRTQLEFLQTRIGLHGTRMWQLPLTYMGLLTLASSITPNDSHIFPMWIIFVGLVSLGALLLWCMVGALEGYTRTARHMFRIETELGLLPSTKENTAHSIPYFAVIALGVIFSGGAAIYLICEKYPNYC